MIENYEKKAGPVVSVLVPTFNLLLEAKIKRKKKDFNSAIELLKTAEQILKNPIRHLSGSCLFSPAQISGHE
jgi:hypothetical protein